MIFDFEPWQLDIDIDLTKQLYRSCKGDFVWVEKKITTKEDLMKVIEIISKILELHTGWMADGV